MRLNLLAIIVTSLVAIGCGSTKGLATGPSPVTPPAPIVIGYEINVPRAELAQQLNAQFPNGVALAPIQAQIQWDFTAEYGTANVYYGPNAPALTANGHSAYQGTSIVIAPVQVAGELVFSGSEWPVVAAGLPLTTQFTWLGKFVFAQAGR